MRDESLGATVTLKVDGEDLIEYTTATETDEYDRFSKTTAHTEVTPGVCFSLEVALDEDLKYRREDIAIVLKLDGHGVLDWVEKTPASKGACTLSFEGSTGYADGSPTLERFAFVSLATCEKNTRKENVNMLRKLGEITVVLQGCRIISQKGPARSIKPLSATKKDISEQALKGRALSSRAQWARQTRERARLLFSEGRVPARAGTDRVFTYNYRTHGDLQAEGNISRSPSPVRLEDRELEILSIEEARELVRRGQAKRKLRIKQEKAAKRGYGAIPGEDDGEDGDEVVVIEERGRSKRAKHTEVIDLSEG